MHKISKALILTGMFAPLGASALGVGDIRLHSGLNQAFSAEIPLAGMSEDDMGDVRVGLASPEAYARAGIERGYLVTKLRFSIQKTPGGGYSIKVSSKEPISEPYLDFLVEVYSPQGRLQREFTVLLDPPDSTIGVSPSEEDLPVTDDVYRQPERVAKANPPQLELEGEGIQRPARQAKAKKAPAKGSGQVVVTGSEYGPVGQNETLWSIARKFQAPSLSPRQMMQAIYKANPDAFYKPSVDALKAGATLTLPDQATLARWAEATETPRSAMGGGRRRGAGEGQVAATVADETGVKPSTQGQLELLPPSASKSLGEDASSGKRGKQGKSREDLAAELADSVRQENDEYRKRLKEMEQQLASLQKLLTLKDEQIATLQAAQQKPAAGEAKQAPVATEVSVQTAVPTPETPKLPSLNPPPPNPATQTATAPLPPAVSKPVEPPPPDAAKPKPPPPRIPVKSADQTKPATANAEKPKERGWLDGLLGHPLLLIGSATGLILAGLWWQYRKRQSEINEDNDSLLTFGNAERQDAFKPAPVVDARPAPPFAEQSPALRSSFLSEFTPSDFSDLGGEMEDVDPVSEADVYLAYGRYKQAEDLILAAIEENPERDDRKLKLLEIYYTTENTEAFTQYAESLASTHREAKPEFWESVEDMGRELNPAHTLFKLAGAVAKNAPSPAAETPTQRGKTENANADVYLFDQEDKPEAYDYPAQPVVASKPEREEAEEGSYDFFATEETPTLAVQPASSNSQDAEPSAKPVADATPSANLDMEIPLDDDIEIPEESMEEMIANLGVVSEKAKAKAKPEDDDNIEVAIELDNAGIGLDDALDGNYNLTEMEGGEEPSSPADEAGSKLELAKAYYQALGDKDAAKSLAEQVLRTGSETQRAEATALLNQIEGKA